MKNWDWGLIGFIAAMVFVAVIITLSMFGINRELEQFESRVGEKVVIESDTLTIVGSQFVGGKYILSNGLKVDASYLENADLKKQEK